ncbi:type I restriction-modification system specificity subunit [Roseibium sp. TrichSKD4]|uniref:restriction endonuclease subunit S n=1 Tax=Roseibium sp. TrichSKD4 TaxID=744980 RepID=UPI0001E56BEF|nr:restriction endonuclease subunit S [Roseibium sp. TrichSKD4]EFO30175.1 type I restriction-modification system specificity subunit [Roseibium sp. TrichSKD4]
MTSYLGSKHWAPAVLQDLVFLQRGFDITKAQQKKGEVPVFSSSGLSSWHNEAKVQGPGIIIGRKGTLGSVHYSDGDYWPHDTTLWSKSLNGNNPRFVYFALKCLGLERFNVGGANPTLNRNHIHGLPIHLPERDAQDRIVSILSTYDDLIENNRRRIALLEEAARLLYREWFVHLRFPGHEHIPITDGLPEGWERRTFGKVAELKYGKALKKENRVEGPFPVYGSSGIVGTHQKALVEGPTIIIGRKGNVGSVFWSPADFWPIDTVYFIPKDQADFWLYLALPSAGFQNTDAGVPGLNRDFAYSRKLVQPKERLRRHFNEAVEPMFAQRARLEAYNEKLSQARDLLLPRLMNGEITV